MQHQGNIIKITKEISVLDDCSLLLKSNFSWKKNRSFFNLHQGVCIFWPNKYSRQKISLQSKTFKFWRSL